MFDIQLLKNAILFFCLKYEDEAFSFKLQHNFRICHRFDITQNYMYTAVKELCIITSKA